MTFIVIYVTHENELEARKIADHLLGKQLIACYNFFPITSSYWWNAEIAKSDEIVTLLKTRSENRNVVKEEVKNLHPYKIPCIMKFEVEANEEYENWVQDETESR